MKKYLLPAFVACCLQLTSQAKIWRVNNSTGVVSDFTTPQEAINAASDGDTIHIEPSITAYAGFNVTKRVVMFATGSFSDASPGIQADPRHAVVGHINVSNVAANGSTLSLAFSDGISINNGVSNITLLSCVGRGFNAVDNANCCGRPHIDISNADNIVVTKCMVSSIRFTNGSNNIVISNNIVWGLISSDGGSDGIITNNVIRAGNANDVVSISNSVIANNIFNKTRNTSFNNCNVSKNMEAGTGTPPDGFSYADMANVFVDASATFVDTAWQLKPASPAIAAGDAGVDLGAFGGASPYRLGGTSPIPSINKLQVPAAPAGNNMNIIFSARSNN